MTIDYRHLSTLTNPTTRAQTVSEMFRAEPYVHLSDAIMAAQGGNYAGQQVLVAMEAETRDGMHNPETGRNDPTRRRRFRLRVICDEWGDPVKPGQIIEWKFNIKNRDDLGRKYTSTRKKELARQGRSDEFREYHAAKVDDELCITVEFSDAARLLNLHGVHYATGLPISKAKELSGTVKQMPNGGMKHVHNWRYVEIPPDVDPEDVAVNRGSAKARMVDGSTPDATPKRKYERKAKLPPAPPPEN